MNQDTPPPDFSRNTAALVVIPTYNERDSLPWLLERLGALPETPDLLVVDDNSPDGTAEVVEAWARQRDGIYLLRRERKEGLGAAYRAGFRWGLARQYSFLVQMDADHSHDPADIPRLLEVLKESDVAVGSRYVAGGRTQGWSRWRQFLSRGGNAYARWVLGLDIRELTGGFNGWRRQVLETIPLAPSSMRGYGFQVELKYRALRAGFRLKEIPILFREREGGKSKMTLGIAWEAAVGVARLRGQVRPSQPEEASSRPSQSHTR